MDIKDDFHQQMFAEGLFSQPQEKPLKFCQEPNFKAKA